jgi:hypothetical protein
MSEQGQLAVLAGAGLVVDAGLPTSGDLAERLRENLVNDSQQFGGDSSEKRRLLAGNYLALYNFINGGVRFQEGVLNRDPNEHVNIEQIAVGAIELQSRMTNPLAAYAAGWHHRIGELEELDRELLPGFVDFTYSRLEDWLALPNSQSLQYLRGLGELCIDGSGLDLFTLNYDACIENALTAGDIKFVNGFDDAGVWSPLCFTADVPVRLYKLHGSLDWVDDQIYGLCSLQFPRHERADTFETDFVRPLLIFGTAHKLSAREPFLTLAYHFSQRVLRTKVLVIVGYSFGDEYVNQIIEQGLKKNADLRVVVVAPRAEDLVRKNRFLDRNPRVSKIPCGAKKALNDRIIADRVRELLKDISAGGPFANDNTINSPEPPQAHRKKRVKKVPDRRRKSQSKSTRS